MNTYTLISKPIDHFPIVLYDKDVHCIDGIDFHFTNQVQVIDCCLSDWDSLPGLRKCLQYETFEGFVVLSSIHPTTIKPITIILEVVDKEIYKKMPLYGTDW